MRHLRNQVLEIRERRDRRSLSVIEQGGVFAGNTQINRVFSPFEGDTAAAPAERQPLVGGGKGAGDAAVAQKQPPNAGDVRLRVSGLGMGEVASIRPEAFLDLDAIGRIAPANSSGEQLLDATVDFAFGFL